MMGQKRGSRGSQPGFIFGGDTGLDYETLQRRRAMADAMARNLNHMPKNVGEGLSALGQALMVRGINKRADKAEAEGRAASDELWGNIFGGGSPRPSQPASGDASSRIKQGLVSRGLPEHVADGFVMNFRDESGLDSGINEKNPIVPGSRGGFGLSQWTGPRRVALEQFAASRGVPVDDENMQLDFLMHELQSSESKAAQSILGTKNSGEAAAAIVKEFLRPAQEHMTRRINNYTGGQSPGMAQIAQAMSDPYIRRDPGKMAVVNALLQQQMRANDPLRQLQIEKAQLELGNLRNPKEDKTALVRNYEAAVEGGYQGDLMQYQTDIKKAGAAQNNITVGGDTSVPDYPKAPNGFMYVRDPATGQVVLNEQGIATMAPIIGGPEDTSAADAKAAQAAAQTEANRSSVVMNTVGEIRDALKNDGLFDLPEVGVVGSKLRYINQEAADMSGMLETLKGTVVFDRLEQLKKASATGASGLGQVTEKEIDLLGAQLDSLKQDMSKERIMATLDTIEGVFGKLSPEAEAYLTGRSEALPSGKTQSHPAPTIEAGSADYSTMQIGDLNSIDIDTLTPAQQEALSRRYQELGY